MGIAMMGGGPMGVLDVSSPGLWGVRVVWYAVYGVVAFRGCMLGHLYR